MVDTQQGDNILDIVTPEKVQKRHYLLVRTLSSILLEVAFTITIGIAGVV